LIKIVPFRKEHLDVMVLRDHEDKLFHDPRMVEALEGSIAETAVVGGRVVCAYGIAPFMDTLAEVWLIPSVYVESTDGMKVARGAKKWLEEMRIDLGTKRMETLCLADEYHDRWMTFLGFECEGVKRKYYKDKDYKMWSRIWE
jgi:hypothetical protein